MNPETSLQAPFRPLSRTRFDRTTYGAMNDWYKKSDVGHFPSNLNDTPAQQYKDNAVSKSAPYMSFTEPNRTDEFYNRYQRLSQNVAYRYPNPGAPREREGSIGGSWRHIKEVLGHGGSRVVFVDGLVRLYDLDKTKMRGGRPSPMHASLTLPAHRKEEREQIRMNEAHQQRCQPWVEGPQLPEVGKPHDLPGSPAKYKGFYALRN